MTSKSSTIALACVVIVVVAAVPSAAQTVDDAAWQIGTHAAGLSQPTGLRFLGADPNEFFVIEKASGRVRHYDHGSLTTALDLDVVSNSERGLLGIEVDPSFASNNRVYVYYSDTDAGSDTTNGLSWTGNELVRYEWNGSTLVNPVPLMTISDQAGFGDGPNHDGGPLQFGPDGYLYGQLGDLNRNRAEQNIAGTDPASAQVGGIFRIDPTDGAAPPDNPFSAHANTDFHKWFSYGFRNSFGMAFDPLTGDLWSTENGPGDYDEINRVTPGQNSGWKQIMGPDSRDAQDEADLLHLANGGSSTYSDPEFSWLETIGVTAIEFLADTALDPLGYEDAVLVGDNNTGRLYLFRLNGSRDGFVFDHPDVASDLVADTSAEVDSVVFGEDFGVLTDLVVGPDNALYAVSLSRGSVYRIVPEPSSLMILLTTLMLTWAAGRAKRR